MTKLTEAGKKVWEKPFYPEKAPLYHVNEEKKEAYVVPNGITYGDWLVGQALVGQLTDPVINIPSKVRPKDRAMLVALSAKLVAIAVCNKPGEVGE